MYTLAELVRELRYTCKFAMLYFSKKSIWATNWHYTDCTYLIDFTNPTILMSNFKV